MSNVLKPKSTEKDYFIDLFHELLLTERFRIESIFLAESTHELIGLALPGVGEYCLLGYELIGIFEVSRRSLQIVLGIVLLS